MLPLESWRTGFDERLPIYQQIISRFCRSLVKGELQPGERIPSIRDMALLLKVNTNTIQRAYQELERMNLIYSQRGMGYFVMQDEKMVDTVRAQMVEDSTARFLEEMHSLGFSGGQIMHLLEQQIEKEGEAHGAVDGSKGA